MFWWNSRVFRSGLPLLSLRWRRWLRRWLVRGCSGRTIGHVADSMATVRCGGSRRTRARRASRCAAAAMLSVHCLYYNAVTLRHRVGTARCARGGGNGRRGRSCWRSADLCRVYVGVPPSMNRRSEWVIIIQEPISLNGWPARFAETLEVGRTWMPWVWVGLSLRRSLACITSAEAEEHEATKQPTRRCSGRDRRRRTGLPFSVLLMLHFRRSPGTT